MHQQSFEYISKTLEPLTDITAKRKLKEKTAKQQEKEAKEQKNKVKQQENEAKQEEKEVKQ
jgi:hypothetical protein